MTAPGSKSNHVCPFCKGVIAAEIALHGGNCPHCLLEVPGEEEATDPGAALAAKKKAAEAVAQRRRGTRNAALAVVVLLMISCAGLVGKYQWDVYQDSLIYELPAYTVADLRNLPEAPDPNDPGPLAGATPLPATSPKSGRTPSTNGRAPDLGEGLGRVGPVVTGSSGAPEATSGSTPQLMAGSGAVAGEVTAPSVGSTGAEVTTSSTGFGPAMTGRTVLSDPDEIKAMVRDVVDGYSRGLDNCYSQALKLNEQLAGTWQLTFTVGANGKVAALEVKALGMKDADFETCMQARAQKWVFSKMVDEFKFKKKFEFSPG